MVVKSRKLWLPWRVGQSESYKSVTSVCLYITYKYVPNICIMANNATILLWPHHFCQSILLPNVQHFCMPSIWDRGRQPSDEQGFSCVRREWTYHTIIYHHMPSIWTSKTWMLSCLMHFYDTVFCNTSPPQIWDPQTQVWAVRMR